MAPEPWILAAAGLLIAGVIASKTSARLGVPSLLLFLGIGMLAGTDGLIGIEFDDFELARNFGIIALAYILFSGGLGTRFRDIRPVLGQGIALASIGVVITAGLLGGIAIVLLDISTQQGLLLGAVIASTDAAAVFSILRSRGVRIDGKLASMLELESGSNDPAAVFLTLAIISVITTGETEPVRILGSFMVQMGLGALAGFVLARGAVWQQGIAQQYSLPELKPLQRFRYRGEGWGLTSDGTHLIQSDGSAILRWRDPADFHVVKELHVRAGGKVLKLLNELEWAQGWILANIWLSDWIVGIDPVTGKAAWKIDVGELLSAAERRTADVPNGIAWHAPSGRLWVSGKHWPWLFCLQVALPPIAPAATPQ